MQDILEFAGNHPFLIAAAIILAAMIVITEVRLRARGFAELAPGDAVQLMNRSAVVLDVRQPERFAAGHIVGARNIPQDRLAEEAEKKLGKLKDKSIITCCDTGASGARAAAQLRKLEFKRVFNLRGGVEGWLRENYPVEKK